MAAASNAGSAKIRSIRPDTYYPKKSRKLPETAPKKRTPRRGKLTKSVILNSDGGTHPYSIAFHSDGVITVYCQDAETQSVIEIALEQESVEELRATLLDTISGILRNNDG